ncbi:13504_t:CDS:2, partial [Gigaspora rosea]
NKINEKTTKLSWTPFTSDYLSSSCEKLPPQKPRKFFLEGPKSRELTIFTWHYLTWAIVNSISWESVSQELCPYPPELSQLFQQIFTTFARYSIPNLSEWPRGYAPCLFWYLQSEEWNTCASGVKYRLTSNYTQWRDADIIYLDYPFSFRIHEPPYYSTSQMPPRKAGQVWWLRFPDEGLGYYWFVGLETFRNVFDMTMEFYKIHTPFDKNLDVLVAYMASNCDSQNNRDDYVKKLMQHITVHSFGQCLHNQEVPDDIRDKYGLEKGDAAYWKKYMYELKRDVLMRYKFVLAFENSNCEGYVTEKVYDPLLIDAIPIYMGATDIDDYVPPHSIIKVTDFKNVEDLANYINEVANNQTLYDSYFEWKKDKTYKSFCKICRQSEESIFCRFLERAVWVD